MPDIKMESSRNYRSQLNITSIARIVSVVIIEESTEHRGHEDATDKLILLISGKFRPQPLLLDIPNCFEYIPLETFPGLVSLGGGEVSARSFQTLVVLTLLLGDGCSEGLG